MEEIIQELKRKKDKLTEELENLNNLYKQQLNYLSILQDQFNTLEGELRELKKREEKNSLFEKELSYILTKKEELINKLSKEKKEVEALSNSIKDFEEEISRISLAISILNRDMKSFAEQLEKIPPLQSQDIKILMAIEEERKRIAREIHDGPAQMLSNVVLRLELLEKLLQQNPERGKQEISSFKEIVKESLKEVRNLIFSLRPMTLDDLGLIPTLKKYLKDIQEHFPIFCEFIVIGKEERISPAVEMNIFRIIQEAVNNVIKHANANNLKIVLEIKEEEVEINIKDDGTGFIPQQYISSKHFSGHLGLISMKERAEILGGIFRIDSTLGKGTSIFVKIPLKKH